MENVLLLWALRNQHAHLGARLSVEVTSVQVQR